MPLRQADGAAQLASGGSLAAAPDRPSVVYISGYGRSGTTVLDIALGQHPRIFGAGELTALTRHVWVNNEYCACGCQVRDCPSWSRIIDLWVGDRDREVFLRRYRALQGRVEGLLNAMPVFRRAGASARALEAYGKDTARLFAAIAAVSGRDIIVDSSKMPGRAFALAAVPGIAVHVLHVVRDGRGVAWSLLKRYDRDVKAGLQREVKPRSLVRTATRWGLVNLATEALGSHLEPGRFVRVRYEDFTADPPGVLGRIGRSLGIDLGPIGADLQRGQPAKPAHQIAGNRLRMQGSINLVRDETWRSDMPAGKRAVFNGLCGWLLKRYGYT